MHHHIPGTTSHPALVSSQNERGSLALEQVLFIGAVLTMSVGLFAFYDNVANYLRSVNIAALPTQITTATTNAQR